jgi:four helix bundle protein
MKNELKYRTYKFSISVIKYCSVLPNSKIYQIIIDQLVRSSTSIGANIIEAQAASSKRDFIKFFEIALKSANETLYWLGLLRDAVVSDKDAVNLLISEAQEIAKILGASVLTLKHKN